MILVAGETLNPVREIPRVIQKVWYRIFGFYLLGVLLVTMVVPSTNAALSGTSNAGASPYVIAFKNAGIPVLPHIVNGIILVSAWSAGNSYAYASVRTFYSMALSGRLPKLLLKVNWFGLPWVCAIISVCFVSAP